MKAFWLSFLLILDSAAGIGDFVDSVSCEAGGLRIRLKDALPIPAGGMWDLEVEGHPNCPGGTKADVGGGHEFLILYADKRWCGVDADYIMTPASYAVSKVTLLLKDDNGTIIADSLSCIYDTRFESSLLTFRSEITSQNLRYGGSVAKMGSDVESTVASSESVMMDFYDTNGQPLHHRNVKLGDPIMFKIEVAQSQKVSKVLPENCYFSSSSTPDENAPGSRTLAFVKKSCFNDKDGMVRHFLPKMERNSNGTKYEMSFPAFYFTGHGKNLFVHCTLLGCVGTQNMCEPYPTCFASNRRRRSVDDGSVDEVRDRKNAKEIVMTKYIIIEDQRGEKSAQKKAEEKPNHLEREKDPRDVCVDGTLFYALIGGMSGVFILLLVTVSCLAGRLCRSEPETDDWNDKGLWYSRAYTLQPPAYGSSIHSIPTATSF